MRNQSYYGSRVLVFGGLFAIGFWGFGQKTSPAVSHEAGFRAHIGYLASDELQGRAPGSMGSQAAANYIVQTFSEAGLKMAGDPGAYTQKFQMIDRVDFSSKVGGLAPGTHPDFKVLPISQAGQAKGMVVDAKTGIVDPAVHMDDYAGMDAKGKIVVIQAAIPADLANSPHGEVWAGYQVRAETAKEKGAVGVIFVGEPGFDGPSATWKRGLPNAGLPILFTQGAKVPDLAGKNLSLDISTDTVMADYQNVSGMIDNGAAWTLVFGAHYDHLGMGEEGSLYRGEPAVHNGADDNASGVAMLIELARTISAEGPKSVNYQFIAFDGEERGLLGSNYYCKHPTLSLDKVTAMLNMDMVGRLDPAENKVILNGVGTSPFWKEALSRTHIEGLSWATTESGIGPSDQTSFYLKDIPVIHFFSGTENDYHRPSDDIDKINFEGMVKIFDLAMALTQEVAAKGELAFSKTQEANEENTPRFTVTLGVVPDYAFEGTGMRIDGVSEGKPAAKAGMMAGDVVIKLGEYEVRDMMGYMKALSKFKKGDKTVALALRGKKKKKFKIQF